MPFKTIAFEYRLIRHVLGIDFILYSIIVNVNLRRWQISKLRIVFVNTNRQIEIVKIVKIHLFYCQYSMQYKMLCRQKGKI